VLSRGEEPYSQAKVDEGFAKLIEAVKKIPAVFPDDTKGVPSPSKNFNTSPKLWDNKADVKARADKIAAEAEAARGKIKSLDDLKGYMPGLLQNCQSCHDAYRLRKS
jgi:cytochrome c556